MDALVSDVLAKMLKHPHGLFVAGVFLQAVEHGFADMRVTVSDGQVMMAEPGLKMRPPKIKVEG